MLKGADGLNRMILKLGNFLISVVALVVVPATILWAQSGKTESPQMRNNYTRSVSDGVYTVVQSTRGKEQYELDCGECHGDDLSGGRNGPLAGEDFMRDWSGVKLLSLFNRVQDMPPDGFRLGDDAYLDIVTYMLEMNEFRSGTAELTTEILNDILIEGKNGPVPPANFALVHVVGCLTRGQDGRWVVTDASEPLRTRNPEESEGDELQEVEVMPLGTQQFGLMFVYPNPAAYEGNKVEVKGFLIRGQSDTINVSILQNLTPDCQRCVRRP